MSNPDAGVANAGRIRPPLVSLAAIVLGVLIHIVWPVRWLPASINTAVGVVLVLLAVALFVSAVRTFGRAGTPVPGDRPTTSIVRTGPYRLTRNPIYLAFTLLHLGVAAWINSLAVLLTVVPAVAIMALVVIPREERYLASRFPAEYLPYTRDVRRWL
ncbi:MAG TPA: isoprenylcysteine carboxylmethyltransferase family protein [Gemmatimonadaceae bacterium]|nr:isoprenylcysteine carboxylmethyltransferase family protein [Gemmatimonadaceae bacterium]